MVNRHKYFPVKWIIKGLSHPSCSDFKIHSDPAGSDQSFVIKVARGGIVFLIGLLFYLVVEY